jgi:sugar phosphate isomerase/epimerase
MNSNNRIIVSLTSFGAYEVRRHGQGWFIELCRQAGADGVEIRGELLQGRANELDELARIVRDAGLDCVYSSPEMLWDGAGALDLVALDKGLTSAQTLNAPVLKMSIGGFSAASKSSFAQLEQKL